MSAWGAEQAPPTQAGGTDLLLMTPGPTRVPARVRRAGSQPMIHHRTPAFSRVLAETIERLRPLFGTGGYILPIHTTGRGGMEAALANTLSPGDEVIACCNGKFGEMWAGIAEIYGLTVWRIATDWEHAVDPVEIEAALLAHPAAKALTMVQSDTSTGVLNDVGAVAALTAERGVLVMVDCISALGGVPFSFENWQVDIAVTASQKCLMSSPGLAFVAVSERALAACQDARLPRSYWDFRAVRSNLDKPKPETPGTAPVQTFREVHEALAMIHEEGLDEVYARHGRMAALARTRAAELELRPQCREPIPLTPTMTALRAPDEVPPQRIREAMKARGILLAGGLGHYTASSFRIGHLGDIRPDDVDWTMDMLAQALDEARAGIAVG